VLAMITSDAFFPGSRSDNKRVPPMSPWRSITCSGGLATAES